MKRRKGFYSISVVAKMFSVHQQTIRMYEKEGLICPKRSNGNTRLFSEEDVDRLEEVIYLTHKLGVNLAGVEMILKLRKKMKRMQDEMNKMFEQTHGQLELEQKELAMSGKEQAQRLVAIKAENVKKARSSSIDIRDLLERDQINEQKDQPTETQNIIDDWQIDYDQD
ncbi:MAG: MerR family transcriptional regulator [Epsilonproteobacteria bacterium]|nr:MerR family transcriptional regulator [Campylobacterota bacterium]